MSIVPSRVPSVNVRSMLLFHYDGFTTTSRKEGLRMNWKLFAAVFSFILYVTFIGL